jgi:hypothetical protein
MLALVLNLCIIQMYYLFVRCNISFSELLVLEVVMITANAVLLVVVDE